MQQGKVPQGICAPQGGEAVMLHERLEAVSASRVDGPAKLVLIMLAKRLDRDDPDGVVWPSSATLAAECGVGVNAITRTMDRLTKAGIVRIVSKAAQGRSARKAIDWAALAAAERDSGPIQNFENHRSGEPRITTAVNLESPARGTLNHHGDDSRITTAVTDPISEPIINPVKGTGHQPDHDTREPTAALTDEQPEPPMHSLLYERVIPGIITGSRPTTDTDPIDNDGDKTSHPESAGPLSPLPDRIERGTASTITIPIEPHADEVTDEQVRVRGVAPEADLPKRLAAHIPPASAEVGTGRAPQAEVAATADGHATDAGQASADALTSTPTAPPATDTGTAPLALALVSVVAPPLEPAQGGASKPKRGKGKQSDETIAAIAAQVDRMMGRTGAALPGSGRWKQLVSAVNEAGAARVLARVTAMADAAQGLPSPAAAIFAAMAGSEYGTGPILRGHNGWTVKLDDALDASAFGEKRASEKPGDVGRVDSRPSGANAPQASQAVSWPDVLRDLGSDPQHHPDDGPHREAWQRVRQAVLVAIRKPGDPWMTWCGADDRARQNVERLLVGGLVK